MMRNKPAEMSNKIAAKVLMNLVKDQRLVLLLLIVVIAVVVGSVNPRFLEIKNIITILQQVSVLGLLTLGIAILMLSGGLDLSVGNIMILSGCIIAVLVNNNLDNPAIVPVAVMLGIATATLAGLINGLIIAKSRCMPLIISLGMSGIYFGIALLISGGNYMSFKLAFEPLRALRLAGIVPINTIIFLLMVLVCYILVNRTKYGRRIVAIGGNEQTAWLSGINVDVYKILTYAISGLLCGIASILYASRLDSITASSGSGYELNALTASIIGGVTFDGGKGSVLGAFLGVIFMGLVANAMNVLNIPSPFQTVISGIIVVVAVIISNINHLRKKR